MNTISKTNQYFIKFFLSLGLGGLLTIALLTSLGIIHRQTVHAADSITVNSTIDDTLANLALNTSCDLREAIVAANNDAQVGQCNIGGGTANTIDFAASGQITLTDNLPVVTDTLIIQGPGMEELTISGDDSYLIFKIAEGIHVTIFNVTLTHGYQYNDGSLSKFGGAINNKGLLTLDKVSINNSVNEALSGYGAYGGAIYSTGGVTITNSKIYSNNSDYNGGGIYMDFASCSPPTMTLAISNSQIYSNTASGPGGAVYVDTDICNSWTTTLKITGSVIHGNVAPSGGGIYLYYTSAEISNTTISGNNASGTGGGISGQADWDQHVYLTNCTIYTNTANNKGGGIYTPESIYTYHLKNTIVAGNQASNAGPNVYGEINSHDYNLFGDPIGMTLVGQVTHTLTNTNPLLGPLMDNGGNTLTHALLSGSPAMDTGSCTDIFGNPVTVDQRGYFRFSPCDIGAYEKREQLYLSLVNK